MKVSEQLKEEIIELIELKYEGPYWDYKVDYCDLDSLYINKAEFLRDIISMANNLENRDAFLIYGVKDDGEIIGIENSKNRQKQKDLIEALKDKKVAGGIRPEIILITIEINGHEIDVLIVKNTNRTPYFITEQFQDRDRIVKGGSIYTRIGDKNTDIDKTADIDKIEYLWRKRFGLDLTTLEKAKFLLKNPKDWQPFGTDGIHASEKFAGQYFHKQFPEFTIVYMQNKNCFDKGKIDNIEYTMYWMQKLPRPLHQAYYYYIELRCHSTVIYANNAVFADNHRFVRTLWKWQNLFQNKSGESILYCYIEKDSLEYLLDNWLCNRRDTVEMSEMIPFVDSLEPWLQQLEYGCKNPYSVVPVFDNEAERNAFITYVKENKDAFIEQSGDYKWDGNKGIAKCSDPECIDYFCKTGSILVEWLKVWKSKSTTDKNTH